MRFIYNPTHFGGIVTIIAAIAVAVYKFLAPDYYDDDDFDFDEDLLFDDEDEEED